jgi:hypothetical protein
MRYLPKTNKDIRSMFGSRQAALTPTYASAPSLFQPTGVATRPEAGGIKANIPRPKRVAKKKRSEEVSPAS